MERRQNHARRVVEYHQNHIADHLIRCERGEGNDKPFRHTLSTSVDPPRRRVDKNQDFLVETHVPPRPGPLSVKPRMVKPLLRLRRPGGLGGSERSSILGPPATPRKALVSPRLPPLVYEGIDQSLAGKRLPAAWFADPPGPKLLGLERSESMQESIQEPSADEAYREGEEPSAASSDQAEQAQEANTSADPHEKQEETFNPPLKAKGLYHFSDFRTEWRACEVLAYDHTEEQFLIQWLATARQKRVTSLQLRFDSETEADALQRQKDAELRRDTVEAMMLEEIVIEELSRWQLGSEASAAVNGGSGASVKRIMDLAQLKRYEASPQVVQSLIREAAEAYCRSQAKWLLLWRRPDLEEYLGVKPVPIREPRRDEIESDLLGLEDDPDVPEESEDSVGSWWEPADDQEQPAPLVPRPRQGLATKGPGGVRGNLRPNRKFRNLSSRNILQKSQELGQLSLLGDKQPQSRLLQVYNSVGSLYCDSVVQLYFPTRKREPYSLAAFARSLVDGFSRSSSFYRISWPESITLFFMTESGIIKDWSPRMSGLVARLMEAGLHHLCLKNLQRLLELFDFYAKLTTDCREGKVMLTYMPPPVYLRMALTSYEQHPLFYIQVTVERPGANIGESSFIPSLELAIEAAFASADSKSLDIILRRKKFSEVVLQMAQRWKLDTAKQDLLPDGAAHGGAPTANNVAALRNTAHMLSQLATGFSTLIPDEALSSDDERMSVDELLMAPPTRRQDIKVLFQDPSGQLEVKLTAHPTEFREVLGDHFRKVVELTEKYSTIDGSLQQDGEVKQQYLASLSSMQKVDQEGYEERITSCFFDPYEVVYEVHQYQALLQRFSHQEEQLKKMANMRFDEVAGVAEAKPEDPGDGSEDEQSQSAHSSFSEERFALGITSSIEQLREHLDRIDGWHKELNEAQDLPERHLGLFVVDVTPLRKALMAMCACCRLRLMGVVQRWLEDACAKLKLSLQAKSGEIIMSPKQPDELHSTILAVKSLDPFLVETAPVLASIRQMFEVLESRYHQVPRALIKRWYECIHAVPDLRDRAEKWQNIFRKDLRGKFNIRIAEKAKILSAQVQECRLVLEEYACKVSLTKAEFYYNKMHKLQERVAKLQEQVEKQHVHEEMMEMPLSEFPGLAATAEQIAPLLDLWFLAHDWNQWQEEILFGEFSKIDPNGVKQKLQSCTETMKRLEEVFATQPRPRQVLHSLSLELTELRVLLPVIVSLRNPGLRERHWTLIGEAIDQNIQANQMKEMNLSNMNERYPFVAHLSKIQAISETASKEMLIEDELRRMQEAWAKLHFEFKPVGVFGEGEHRVEEESSSMVADLHHAEVWELITEQMAKVRAIGRRPNAAVHEKDLVAHDAKLKIIGELCDRLYEAQYGYVLAREHMLQEGLVKELMQRDTERNKEWKRFFEVEKQWQNIMMHLKSSNTWLQLLEVPKISFFCREAAATMEHIQRSIHDVLDIHRKQVPHLYRLSDAELMRVIRYGSNPAEPAIRPCLPGIFSLDLGPSVMSEGHAIRGLVGDVGEYLSLTEELAVQENMQIKDWLPKLTSQMSHLLRWSMFGLMLSNFNASDPRLLDEKYPLQVRAAALDLAFTTEVEGFLVESTSGSMLQTRRLTLNALIDQIQERRLQAADSEDRGVEFESFMAGSSSEEETEEEEETETEESEEENEDGEEEEEESEELTSDESVESDQSDEPVAGGRMAARKAVRLEPPPLAGGLGSARSSRAEGGRKKEGIAARALLPEHVQDKVPWQLFRIGVASALQQLLRWREVLEQLELERPEGLQGKLALTSYRWMTTLRHYMRSKTATNGEEFQSYVDRGQYTLSMAGFDIGYAWQYLGNIGPAGRMYWDPQTEKGQLIMVHSFATARGVMSCGECRGEAPAYLARQLGIVQERIFVNWRTSFLAVWRHLEGAMLAKMWLTISLEVSAHVQVLSVLAQELHSHLNACRLNLSMEAPTSWVSLECSQAMLSPQKLPLLLLQAFRPQALATPSLDALCELWLLSSSMRPTTAKTVAPLTAFAWRFCEATELLSWTSHQRVVHSGDAGRSAQADIGRAPKGSPGLWQLRLLCDTAVKITIQVRRARRLAKGRASSDEKNGLSDMADRSQVRRPSVAREELESERPRRPSVHRTSVQGSLMQETLAPPWARACLYRAFQVCFFDKGDASDGATELMKLLNVSEEDLKVVADHMDRISFESDAKAALEEMGLTARESQIQALQRMNSWVDQCHSEIDYCVGMPPTRAILVLGDVAVGKSSCIDALSRQAEPWELRRLNTTSLALDACDALQRPVAGSSRLLPPNSSMGVLDTGARLPGKTRKVLVHVDGELGPLQESFLSSLNGVSEPCSAMRQGLQISKQSWLNLPGGVFGHRLAVAFEMGVDGCQSLGPDLVTRCGVVHLMEEDLSAELSSLIQSWCNQVEARFENANISHTVQCLCKEVLVPLMLLVYGDQIKAGASGLLADASQKLTELSSTATVSVSRKTIKKRPVTSKLSQQWALPLMPCRALFLRVQQAFQDVYGHFDRGRTDGDPDADDHNRRQRTETIDSNSQAGSPARGRAGSGRSPRSSPQGSQRASPRASPRGSPRGSPRTSRVAVRRQEKPPDDIPEAPSESTGKGRRKSSFQKQLAKKASTLLLLPEVDALQKEEVVVFDSEATVAFIFATLSSFKALLHDNAAGLLEEFALRLVDLIGPAAAHVRLPVEFSILDSVPDEYLKNFYHVDSILKEPDMADLDSYIFVPTQQSKRFLALSNVLQRSQSPLLLLGPCGSGKSLLLSQMIAQLPLRENPVTLPATFAAHCGKVVPTTGFGSRAELLYMSATQWIQPGVWERSLQSLTRSSKTGLRPRLYSWCVFVIDDCHCAQESLREAWRFNLERKLVHFPGSAGISPNTRKGFAGKRGFAERLEREATLPSLQHLEGVMMVMAARALSDMASRHNFLRHTWMYNLEPLQESDVLKIVGENMSHFIFVKDISPTVTTNKMLYVRFLHSLQLKLQETQGSTRLITPHVLFRFFKSLLSQPTECLCDLKPPEFHKFFMHELLRETVDRLPIPRQKSAIMELAQLQHAIFGGLDRHRELRTEGPSDNISEASGVSEVNQEEQIRDICETLHALQYTSLEPVTDASKPQRVEKHGYGEIEDPDQLCSSLRLELQRGWERAKAMTSEVSPMLWSLNAWGADDREPSFQEMLRLRYVSKGFERNCAGLEPRHLILSDEYILYILRLGRLFELAAGASQNKVWGRQGGKTLVLAPSIPVAICVIRGAAHLYGLSFDTPLGRPATEGGDTGTTQGMPVLGLSHEGLNDADQGGAVATMSGSAFRQWIKEKLLTSIQELSTGMVLCIPPAILNHQENLAVLHEAFAQEGPPPHWYNEREVKECEDAVAALPGEARLLAYLALEDEDGEAPATLDVFWAEALGRIQFVLLLSNDVPEDRISCGQCTISTLDASCPQFLQMAVLHMSPPSVDAYSAAAKVQLSSPILDPPETWQPISPFKAEVEATALAEAAAELVRVAHFAAKEPPAGMAPRFLRSTQVPGLGVLDPTLASPQSSAWDGEALQSALLPALGGLGDVGDILYLAQSLCRFQGQELARQYNRLKDAHNLLEDLQKSAASSQAGKLQQQLTEITRRANEAQEEYEEKQAEHSESQKELMKLVDEVVNRCTQKANAVEAAEELVTKSKSEVESGRFQLLSFGKQDGVELRKAVNQHCSSDERTPTLALMELCCMLMRVSATPTREEVRTTLSEPNFATKLAATCAVDAETFPEAFVEPMKQAAATADGLDTMDIKALTVLANVALPACQYTVTMVQLPSLRRELRELEDQREQRRPEVEDLETQTKLLYEDAQLRKAKADELSQEMTRIDALSTSATSKRSRTTMMCSGLRQDRIRWGWKLQELQRKLQCLVGDALLSAAATQLLGSYGPQHREELLEHWKEVLDRLSIPCSKDFDLASYWIVPTARFRLHTELALPKDIHLEEGLVFACLQTSKWPVFYDPDHLAPGFLQKFFPGAIRLTMGSTDFQKDLLSALSSRAAVTSPSDVSEVLGQVIIIENAYLPAIRDTDILTELVARRQLVAAGLQTAGLVQLSAGVEDTVVHVDPRIVLMFITEMGEPWNHDAWSKNFLMIDFQLSREEEGLSGPLLDLMTETVCAKALPSVHQELKQLGPEFSQLMAEWYRQDKELIQKLAFHHHEESEVEFPTEEQLRETMNMKINLESIGRRLVKARDSEVKLQQQRAVHDLLVSSLCSMAAAAEEIFGLCPASSISLSGAWRLCEEFLPEPPSEDRKKSNRDSDYAGMARRAVLAGLWERIAPGLPRQFALAAALRLTMASAVPHQPLQEVLGKLLLQCPAGDPQVFQHSLNGLLCSAMQAILQGRGLSESLQLYRQVEGAPQNPRPSFQTLFKLQGNTGRQSSKSRQASKKSNSSESRSGSKTLASVSRSLMSLGNLGFSEMLDDEESEEEELSHERRSSTADTSAALRAAGEAERISSELMQQVFVANKGHWSHCNSKQTFLARFAYFQEALRCQLEHCIHEDTPTEMQSKESASLPDLFRVNRVELFGIDEKYLEDLLAEAPGRENKDFLQRRSTRNLVPAIDEGGENVAEGGADTPQLFSLLLHFGASSGHGACGPWDLQLHVEPQARSLVDRLEDSVNNDPSAWARWAESIATQNYRKSMTGNNALVEHLPLLASLPHELLSSLLPQGGPSSHVTLKTICGAGFLQTLLFSVLASFSLSAVLHAAELIVAGATGIPSPLRRVALPRLLEREAGHRSAASPVLCLCDSEASFVVENIHRIHQKAREEAAGGKVIQLSLTDLVSSTTTGKAGQPAGECANCWSAISPAAECASTPSGVLELLEECKDLGYWLLLHLKTNASRLSSIEQLGLEVPHSSFQLLERIWFTCSTPSFQSTADEKFRLFVIIDCRCPVALPSWLFRCGRAELCVVDSAVGTPSLRSWLEEALDAMPRRPQIFASSMVLPSAPSPSSSKVANGYKTLSDAANGSQLAAEGKLGRVTTSPVLCSKLALPNFPLKLQTSAQRLAMLVLAAACDGGLWPKCLLKTRSMGPRVAEVVEELHFDVTLRSVDLLEMFAPLALQQAQKCPIWPDASSFPGPSVSSVLYNLLRHIRQVHLSKLPEIFTAPSAEQQKNTTGEVSKRSSAARSSQLNVLASGPRKSRKNLETHDLDELLWYHDEHFESRDFAWKIFTNLVDAMERISNQGEHCGEAEEQQLQDALKMVPLLEPFSIRLAAPCDAIFTLALTFSKIRRGRLKLPALPDHLQEAVTPEVGEAQTDEPNDVELDEVQEALPSASEKRKVSGVQTLQFQIPSMGQLPSDVGSSSEEDQEESAELALGRRVVDGHSASRMALSEILKATRLCVESSELPKIPPRPEENESPLQAEWRRQRSCIARWAWDIHAEASALIRGLEGDGMSPKMSLKLRQLLHNADLWAARAEPEDDRSSAPVATRLLAHCPIEVFHVAKSHAASTLPVPEGWQPPHLRDEANFGSWLSHLAMQLHDVYASETVPRDLHISELAQLEPLLLSLRLCLAGQRNLQVEQTCLVFLPSAPEDESPDSPTATSSRSEHKAVSEDFTTWDELDTERPPAFKAVSTLSQSLAATMAPLFAEKAPPESSVPTSPTASTGDQPASDRKSAASATFAKSVRKVAMMASLTAKPGRRSTVKPGTKKMREKDPTFVQKEISKEDLVLQGLLADGAVWSSQGLHIDNNVAGVTRLPPLRVVAATLKAAEYIMSQAFPQALGCMNLFVHRLFGSPWPLPTEGLMPRNSLELCTIRLPFWSKPQNRWQPVVLLDSLGPIAAPGHLRQGEDDLGDSSLFRRTMEEHLEEPLSVVRPFGLLPTDALLTAMAGPPMLSRRKAR